MAHQSESIAYMVSKIKLIVWIFKGLLECYFVPINFDKLQTT